MAGLSREVGHVHGQRGAGVGDDGVDPHGPGRAEGRAGIDHGAPAGLPEGPLDHQHADGLARALGLIGVVGHEPMQGVDASDKSLDVANRRRGLAGELPGALHEQLGGRGFERKPALFGEHADALIAQGRVGRLDGRDHSGHEARDERGRKLLDLARVLVGDQHDACAAPLQLVEGVQELALRRGFVGKEMNVVDAEQIDAPESAPELLDVAGANARDVLVHERLAAGDAHRGAGVVLLEALGHGVEQVGFADAAGSVDKERTEGPGGLLALGDLQRGIEREPIGLADDKRVQPVSLARDRARRGLAGGGRGGACRGTGIDGVGVGVGSVDRRGERAEQVGRDDEAHGTVAELFGGGLTNLFPEAALQKAGEHFVGRGHLDGAPLETEDRLVGERAIESLVTDGGADAGRDALGAVQRHRAGHSGGKLGRRTGLNHRQREGRVSTGVGPAVGGGLDGAGGRPIANGRIVAAGSLGELGIGSAWADEGGE